MLYHSHDGGECRNEVGTFHHQINHYHDCVMSCRLGEFNDEVHTDGVMSQGTFGLGGDKFSDQEMPLCFGLETEVTSRDVLPYVLGHLGPPIIPGYQLKCLPPSGVTSNLRVMAQGNNAPAQVKQVQDIGLPVEVKEFLFQGSFSRLD